MRVKKRPTRDQRAGLPKGGETDMPIGPDLIEMFLDLGLTLLQLLKALKVV
jgi:hypothetical protein